MASVIFIYDNSVKRIICNINDKIGKIIENYLSQCFWKLNDFFYFYDNHSIDLESTFSQTANKKDRENKSIIIYVYDKPISIINESKDVICPKCKENCQFRIEGNFIITLCKNGHKNAYSFQEFDITQNIDLSIIKCDFCKSTNKITSEYFGTFYYCLNCKKNICFCCKKNHDRSHDLIDYNYKKGTCLKHSDYYCSK